jgi:threonine synthase
MRYTSTRDKSINASFEDALTSGYASDGGLFVPKQLPKITRATLRQWIYEDDCGGTSCGSTDNASSNSTTTTTKATTVRAITSYSQLMYNILRVFIDNTEISNEELQRICQESVSGFDDPIHCIPVQPFWTNGSSHSNSSSSCNNTFSDTQRESNSATRINRNPSQPQHRPSSSSSSSSASFYVAELFHGPTFCFKDLGMRAVIHLLYTFAKRKQQQTKVTLLVSTTGDTGPAAAQTIYDINDPIMNIIVHYPYQQISSFQEQQLVSTITSPQIEIVSFHGGGDDMDIPIKKLLASQTKLELNDNDDTASTVTSLESSSLWTGVNSYNIVRFFPFFSFIWFLL